MEEKNFGLRLSRLRAQKGVSAREMSLCIGQNPGYINSIETGKSLPSMAVFFFICEYLGVTPYEFFDEGSKYPESISSIVKDLQHLDERQLTMIAGLVRDLSK